MTLSIVIVPYKCKDKLRVALQAVYDSKVNFDYHLYAVDNDSNDGTKEMVEQEFLSNQARRAITTFIVNPDNRGFSKANNQGIELAKDSEYILLLNPDTKVAPDTFQIMLDFMRSRTDVGISTCKLIKEDGSLDLAARRSFPNPVNSFFRVTGLSLLFPKNKILANYNLTNTDPDQEMEIDSCVGAFMFVSRACMDAVKGFDEDYYMYGEDIDMCYRAHEAGFKVWYYPKTTTFHYKGQSSRKSPKKSLFAFHDTMWIYYKKHLYGKHNFLVNSIVYTGIWSRYWLKSFQNYFRKEKFVSK